MTSEFSMDDMFIKKLTKLLEDNLENENFGVNELTKEIGMSRSKLHRKLNALTSKSTSQFIREFRLEKAMEMLQNEVATASEIAYRVGFSSPTYFNTSFRDYYGYPPGEVKLRSSLMTEEDENNQVLGQNDSSGTIKKKVLAKGKPFKQTRVLVFSLAILILIAGFSYFFYERSNEVAITETEEIIDLDKSIAVLPFKNLSDNMDNQYFADGMRDDLINHLSKIEDIIIKSRQSSDRYGSSVLTGSEIGEALGVNYIIDGSVQKYGDRIKIIVHLINASNDSHLWSKDFDREFSDIFQLESEISKAIASELDVVLSPTELQQIEKIPTQQIEAYNLYLKGTHFLYRFTDNDFSIAENYFKQSIALDPEFALPYSGLAELILHRGFPTVSEKDYIKAKEYALQAMALDNNLSETHRVLATIHTEYEWNWEAAEKEYKIAIAKNPKSSSANIFYARYLMYIKGDFDKSREYINKAILLAPVAYYFYTISAEYYLLTGDYGLALKEANTAIEINPNDLWAHWVSFLAYAKQGRDDLAVKKLAKSWNMDLNYRVNVEPMLDAYESEGIKGVFRWINNLDIEHATDNRTMMHNAYWIAQKFAFIGEHDKAIEWLEIAYKRKNSELYRVKYDHFFKELRSDSRFLFLLEKMNLGNYSYDATLKN